MVRGASAGRAGAGAGAGRRTSAGSGGMTSSWPIWRDLSPEIAPRFADRPGGYTRIMKHFKHRIGDASDLVVWELVEGPEEAPEAG